LLKERSSETVFVVSDDPLGLNPENCMRTFRTHATC